MTASSATSSIGMERKSRIDDHVVTDTGLAQQTTYVYSVAANCKGGVVSDRSVETEASTVTTVDITRPTVIATSPANGATGVSRAGTRDRHVQRADGSDDHHDRELQHSHQCVERSRRRYIQRDDARS